MADFTADFEKGTNGNTITTGDAGSATPWWIVNGTPSYSNAHAAHGGLAAKIAAADASCDLAWQTLSGGYGRAYIYATAYPSGTVPVFYADLSAHFDINASGFLFMADVAANSYTGTVPIPLNQWCRIEWKIVFSPTVGQIEMKLFAGDSTTPLDTITSPANGNTGTAGGSYCSVRCRSWGTDVWVDDIVANATSYPGPVPGLPQLALPPVIYGRGAC